MSVDVVVGGQAGSEGKGSVCDWLHRRERKYTAAVRVGGPNAGHTVVDEGGRAWALRQIPVAAVSDRECELYIAAGSEVDFDVLITEVEQLEEAGIPVRERLMVDSESTMIDREAVEAEGRIGTGTTGKGIGGARARRALRQAGLVRDDDRMLGSVLVGDTQSKLRKIAAVGHLLVEGTQGHVLGSHAGFYPYSTSGDCRAADFLAWCGLPPLEAHVWLVLRMHPIRIAGNSGPLPGETTWEGLGVAPEKTTVTKKIRRVGHWNWQWPEQSVAANLGPGGLSVALTFTDYDYPEIAGWDGTARESDLPSDLQSFLVVFHDRLRVRVGMLGTGPRTHLKVLA